MPRRVSEISSGGQFSRSSEEGRVADSQTRVFKILLNPGETADLQEACGVFIGDQHPYNENIYCTSFSSQWDGESRTVLVCTFQYASTAAASGGESGQDPKSSPPDVRPSNWTTSTSLVEVPAREWYVVNDSGVAAATKTPAKNSADDMYDGISYLTAMVNISVDQLEPTDPTRHISHCGKVNSVEMYLGSLTIAPRTLMFRGVSCKPTVESWGRFIFRGWVATYEFAYRSDTWDLRVPQSGLNVKCVNPVGAGGNQDIYGQPLKHTNQGKIKTDPITELAETLFAGDRARAMVRVHSYDNGGASQLPSAQPIALNDDGTPRRGDPLVKRYCPYDQIDLAQVLQLRLT
jgi:hypothetical protein